MGQAQVEAFARKNKHYALQQVVATAPATPGKAAPYVPPIIFEDDDDDEREVHVMLSIVLPENADAFHVQVWPDHFILTIEKLDAACCLGLGVWLGPLQHEL